MDDGPGTRTLIDDGRLRFSLLEHVSERPAPFAPGEPRFWDDPHIARQMLAAHLDPDVEAASRPPEVIDRTVDWLVGTLGLRPGDPVLDLGCGPGLYSQRLARRGLTVTGLDLSQGSIDYAIGRAADEGLDVIYHRQDYLTLDAVGAYRAILLIYGDLCPLSPERRDQLLARVRRALVPGGRFVFDVTTRRLRARAGATEGWSVSSSGFWKAGPHLTLTRGFDYPDLDTYLDQYITIEDDGTITVYRNWFLDYSLESITEVLAAQGFVIESSWSDLMGTPLGSDPEWIGVVATVG